MTRNRPLMLLAFAGLCLLPAIGIWIAAATSNFAKVAAVAGLIVAVLLLAGLLMLIGAVRDRVNHRRAAKYLQRHRAGTTGWTRTDWAIAYGQLGLDPDNPRLVRRINDSLPRSITDGP